MKTIQQLIEGKAIGEPFYVNASQLGMSTEQFNLQCKRWADDGGGDGFAICEAHPESHSGDRQFDLIRLMRTE